MSKVVRAIGVVVTVGLIVVSLMMNFRFGQSLGRSEWDGLVYGLASASADGFKVILPFAVTAAWRTARGFAAVVGAGLWLVFTAYSMTSSLGHSAVNRAATAGERRHEMASYRDVRRRVEMKLQERESIPSFRPLEAVRQEIETVRRQRQFETSRGCSAVGRTTRPFCESYSSLLGEMKSAERARVLDAEVEALRAQVENASAAGKSEQSDAQTALLKELSGVNEDYVRLALTVMVSIMVELGSGLGLYVVLGQHVPGKADGGQVAANGGGDQRKRMVEQRWLKERVAFETGAHAGEIELYRDYCLWVVQKDVGPAITLSGFREWLAAERGLLAVRKRGRNYVVGVKLRAAADGGGAPVMRAA